MKLGVITLALKIIKKALQNVIPHQKTALSIKSFNLVLPLFFAINTKTFLVLFAIMRTAEGFILGYLSEHLKSLVYYTLF